MDEEKNQEHIKSNRDLYEGILDKTKKKQKSEPHWIDKFFIITIIIFIVTLIVGVIVETK